MSHAASGPQSDNAELWRTTGIHTGLGTHSWRGPGHMQTPGPAEMRAVSQQASGVSWLLMGTGDGVYIWEPPKGSAPCLDDTAFAQSHRSHCHDAAPCGKRCPAPQGSFVPASNSLSLPQTCFSASSYALPTPTRLLRTDFISALSMWLLYSNEIHRNDRANLCSGIANEFSVF